VREGLLVRDPLVEAALRGGAKELSPRSVQRRFLRATCLTGAAIRQTERAVELLERGASIVDAVGLAGFVDQAHMTRVLKRLVGQTPGQILRAGRHG